MTTSAAGVCAALIAHALLAGLAGAGSGASSFEQHVHGSVAPAMVVVAALFVFGAYSFVSDARRSRSSVVVARAKNMDLRDLCAIGATVAVVASVTLFGMEFAESSRTAIGFGWLGGNVVTGFFVLLIATLGTTGAVKFASDARRVALDRAIALLSKIVRAIAARVDDAAKRYDRFETPVTCIRRQYVGRNAGLRAPPLSIA